MKKLTVYDSQYGNTEKIARAIDKNACRINEVTESDLKNIDILISGSPTQGGRPTAAMAEFLNNLPAGNGIKAAVFDTRMDVHKQVLPLKILMNGIGYAADKMETIIKNKGYKTVGGATGFIVTGKTGPIQEGELEKAAVWAKRLA